MASKQRHKIIHVSKHQYSCVVQVKTAEGFSKGALFEKLAPLEAATRPLMAAARQRLAKEKGQSALQPWTLAAVCPYSCGTAITIPCLQHVPGSSAMLVCVVASHCDVLTAPLISCSQSVQ